MRSASSQPYSPARRPLVVLAAVAAIALADGATMQCARPLRVAVIGGGVSGCTLAHALKEEVAAGRVATTLFEMGRGGGGRSATRKTRDDGRVAISHGAPSFKVTTHKFRALLDGLPAGTTVPLPKPVGALVGDAFEPDGDDRRAGGAGAAALCDALLRDSGADPRFRSMVRGIERTGDGAWALRGTDGSELGRFDWLAVSGSGVAHDRWTATFGGEPPLKVAAASLGDAALDAAIAAVNGVTSKPVMAVMLAFDGAAAKSWAALPWSKAAVDGDAVLARVVVERVSDDVTNVVLHSTHAFAEKNKDVYGATSTAARVGGAMSDASREEALVAALLSSAEARLAAFDAALAGPFYGPHLHRWGSAFPAGVLVPPDAAVVPSARVVFLGDYVDTGRAGTLEGAALSGLAAAEALVDAAAAA